MEHFARGQIDRGRTIGAPWQGANRWGISPGGRKFGAPCRGAVRSEHIAREQIGGSISPGGRMIGAPCQGSDRWGNSTGGRKIGALS